MLRNECGVTKGVRIGQVQLVENGGDREKTIGKIARVK